MDQGTFIRTIILGIALINQLLVAINLEPVPGDKEVWYQVVSTIFTVVSAIAAWWRNNYISARGRRQLKVLQREHLTDVE